MSKRRVFHCCNGVLGWATVAPRVSWMNWKTGELSVRARALNLATFSSISTAPVPTAHQPPENNPHR